MTGKTYEFTAVIQKVPDIDGVNMGIKNPDGSTCYILGIRKDIRARIQKQPGDKVQVTIKERQ